MAKNTIIIYVSLLINISLSSQTIKNPSCSVNENPSLSINFIKKSKKNTIISFTHSASIIFENGGWIYISGNIKLIDKENNLSYKLISFTGIDTSLSKRHNYITQNDSINFNLIFEPLNIKTKKIDIIECSSMNCFNFFDVNVSDKKNIYSFNSDSIIESIPNVTLGDTKRIKSHNIFNFSNNRYYGFKMIKEDGSIETFKPTSKIIYANSVSGESLLEYNILGDKGTRCTFQFIAGKKISLLYSNAKFEFTK